jgi:murein DD-endopeptidase MepM/ murein hydrolase activator NlpD
MAADPWDSTTNEPKAEASDELADRLARAAAAQRARALSDTNAAPARIERDSLGRYIYETAPVPIKRLFGSPLAMKGSYSKGPNGERLVSSGWGTPRSTGYDRNVNSNTRHHALDFVAPYGEEVYASASGKVVFAGVQLRSGSISVPGLTTNNAKAEIYNAKGEVIASKALANIGFGGVAVYVQHDADFQGYKTGYFHLSEIHVQAGEKVVEGQLIGKIGGTGGYYGWYYKGYHLHYQIEFTSGGIKAIVRPTAIVPNYWPGHQDSTNSSQAADIIMPLVTAVGGQVAASRVANVLSSINRATTIQNKGVQDVKQDQSTYASHVAQTIDVQRTAIYATQASFQGNPPVVTAPMTFDFDNGVWLVNGQDNGAV